MAKFLRFGKIPEKGKSINFFKLTLDQCDDFNFFVSTGYTSEEAAAELKLDNSVFEKGVSAFEVDDGGNVVLTNVMLIRSLCEHIKGKEEAYIIEGDKVGIGNDGEALVGKITDVREHNIDIGCVSDYIFEVMQKNFKYSKGKRKRDNLFFSDFHSDGTCRWRYNGVDFYEALNNEFVTLRRGDNVTVIK